MTATTTINPTTGAELASYENQTDDELGQIVDSAHDAFDEWRRRTMKERAGILVKIGELLTERSDDLAKIITDEMGKLMSAGRREVQLCAAICSWTAENCESELADEERQLDGGRAIVSYQPVGIILGIQPFNFPVYQAIHYSIPQLAVGNPVLLKHASSVWGSALMLEEIYHEAGLPREVFRVIKTSNDQTTGLISDPRVRGVTLTGSGKVGSIVAAEAGKHLKKTVMELRSNDAYLVLSDADIPTAVKTCVQARMYNNGETCVAAKRFVVVDSVYEEFRNAFVESMRSVHAAQARIAETATQNIRAGDGRVERASELLSAARKLVDRWRIGTGSEWLVAGIAASYRGCRRDLRRARSRPTDPRLHEWRKHVKTLWYQMRLIEAAAPSVLTPLVRRLDDLAEALGDDHDLSVLVKRLKSDQRRFGGKKVVKRAVRRARSQQDDLRKRAFRLGASLFAEPTSAFVARIDRYWVTTIDTGVELATGGIAELLAEAQATAEDTKVGERSEPPTRSLEMERKFLLSDLPELPDTGTTFRQGYLAIDGSVSLRVRDANQEGYTLTVKAGRGSVRPELEWAIDGDQFDRLWKLTAGRRIEKVRYTIPVDPGGTGRSDLVAEVDVFHGELEGLLIAEVEFESVESMDRFRSPAWFGSEVTDDVSYTNASLSMQPPGR